MQIRQRHATYQAKLLTTLLVIILIFYSYYLSTPEEPMIFYWTKGRVESNLSCFYAVEDDALPSAEDPSFSPGSDAIFFHETTCRGGLNSRQACTMESAARLHPNNKVIMMFNAPVTEFVLRRSNLAKLLELPNVKFVRVHIQEYGKGTPVETVLTNKLNFSWHLMVHTADILRIVTLYKFGGIFLDTDSLVVRNLGALPKNFIAKESSRISTGIMSMSKKGPGANLMYASLEEIRDTYIPEDRTLNGPKLIERILDRLCTNVTVSTGGDCAGVEIYNYMKFYPLHYRRYEEYFKDGDIDNREEPYMHHMWNFFSKEEPIEADSPYVKLAKQFCPSIYNMYGKEFGD